MNLDVRMKLGGLMAGDDKICQPFHVVTKAKEKLVCWGRYSESETCLAIPETYDYEQLVKLLMTAGFDIDISPRCIKAFWDYVQE